MPAISGLTSASHSLSSVWNQIGNKTAELSEQIASGDPTDASFVQTVVELKALKLQAEAAGMVFQTLQDMAGDLLSRPRK